MKKLIFLCILAIAGIIGLTGITYAENIFSDDFQDDPGWITTDSENVYWDSASGYYYTHVQDDGSPYYGYSPTFTTVSSSSFTMKVDINPQTTGWGTYPNLILQQENADGSPREGWQVRFEVHLDDHNYNLFILVVNGVSLEFSPTFNTDTWYHHVVDYDHRSETLIWEVTERDTGEAFHSARLSDVTIGDFNQIVAGHQGVSPHYGRGHWATTLFDNISICDSNYGGLVAYYPFRVIVKCCVWH